MCLLACTHVARVPIALGQGGVPIGAHPTYMKNRRQPVASTCGSRVGRRAHPPFLIGRPCGQDEVGKSTPIGLFATQTRS